MQTIKAGYLTTEFALVVAGMIVALIARLGIVPTALEPTISSNIAQGIAAIALGVLPIAYATLRTWLKVHASILPTLPDTLPAAIVAMPLSALPSTYAVSAAASQMGQPAIYDMPTRTVPITPFISRPAVMPSPIVGAA